MLDSAITGIYLPEEEALDLLNGTEIYPRSRVIIYRTHEGLEYPTELVNVLGYETSEDKQFGASALAIDASNEDGLYSYKNVNSDYNKLYKYATENVQLDFTTGEHKNTVVYSDSLFLEDATKNGEWTSAVVFGGTPQEFYRWAKIKWDIQNYHIEHIDGLIHYTTVNLLYRYGDSYSTTDGSWSPWVKFQTLSTSKDYNATENIILTEGRYIQVKAMLYHGDEQIVPEIKSISLDKDMLQDSNSIIENQPLYYYGNRIEVREYITSKSGQYEQEFMIFNGFIDEVIPSHNSSGFGLACNALDFMKMCLNDFIEKPNPKQEVDKQFEPNMFGPETIELLVVNPGDDDDIPVAEDDLYSIFRLPIEYRENGPIRGWLPSDPRGTTAGDRKYLPWAQRPKPSVIVDGKSVSDGYEIDYERGIIFFGAKQEIEEERITYEYEMVTHTRSVYDEENNWLYDEEYEEEIQVENKEKVVKYPKIEATFYWYDMETNLYEDVVGEIIAQSIERFEFEKPSLVEPRHEDYDIWRAESNDIEIILERPPVRTTIPPMTFNIQDNKKFHDALVDINKYITPDYYLRATPEGKFIGEHLPQKMTEDYELTLIEEMETPISDAEVYTRCIARGIVSSVRNAALKAKIDFPVMEPNYTKPGSDGDTILLDEHGKGLIDGDMTTNVGWHWSEDDNTNKDGPATPQEMVRFEFTEPIRLGAVNILCGDGVGHGGGSGNKWGLVNLNGLGYRIEVSSDSNLWFTVTENDLIGSSGEWLRIDKSSFLSDIFGINVKYLRIMATNIVYFDRGASGVIFGLWGKRDGGAWNWALRQVQIFPNEEIRKEVTLEDLVEDNIVQLPANIVEDLRKRIGTKTVILPVDGGLRTEEMVAQRAKDYLYEACRNLYTSTIGGIYAPHVRVGHTVGLKNDHLLGSKGLYYVNSIQKSMDGTSPSVQIGLVQWI